MDSIRFHLISIFPEIFGSFLSTSLVGKALRDGRIQVELIDPRDFTTDRHRTVDDTPFGGGDGMVMKPEPLVEALESIRGEAYRILLTPQGEPLSQGILKDLSLRGQIALICGRYEGYDDRVRAFVDREISLGDFVLNGGEVAAMAIIDGLARLIPGVLGNLGSLTTESHTAGLLEYPQYTRPRTFRDSSVPEILLGGDHEAIRRWRRRQMLLRTRTRRPDLWRRYQLGEEDLQLVGDQRDEVEDLAARTYVALLHHPVLDREGREVATAITNLDLHDIARSCRTYGLGGYFVVTPLKSQQELAHRIVEHWRSGHGATYNPSRCGALQLLQVTGDLAEVTRRILERDGTPPITVVTSARRREGQVDRDAVVRAASGGKPLLLLLGTGWGLAEQVFEGADLALEPFSGRDPYNHLSVRSAAAILLDRFFGLRH